MYTRLRQLKLLLNDRSLLFVYAVVMIFLLLFVVFPLLKVVQNSLWYQGRFVLEHFLDLFAGRQYVVRPLVDSILVATVVSILSTFLGFIFAYATAKAKVPGTRLIRWVGFLPIVSPPFIMAMAAILLFGHKGLLTTLFRNAFGTAWNIYGFPGLVITETVTFFPLAYLILEGVLQNIDPALEESALDLGASKLRTFFRVTVPLSAPGLAGAMLLVFVRSLEDFGNPIIIQGRFPVLTTQIYLAVTGMYNIPLAATLSIVLLTLTLIVFSLQRYWLSRKTYVTITGKPSTSEMLLVSNTVRLILTAIVWFFSLLILLFYGIVIFGSFTKLWGIDNTLSLDNYKYVFLAGGGYLLNSLKLSGIATAAGALFGTVIAYVVARKRVIGRGLIDFLGLLNFAVPGIIIGIGYILAFNTPPIKLTGTALIIVLVFISQRMPVVIRDGIAMLQQIDPAIDEAASDLGAGFFRTFAKVVLPLIAPAFLAGMAYMFAACMTSISAVIMVISPKWYLATVALLSQVDIGALSRAAAYGSIIIGVVIFVVIVTEVILKRVIKWLVTLY